MTTLKRYNEMREFDFDPVVSLIKREGFVEDTKIDVSLDGLIQWLAGHAVKKHDDPYVMLHGDVDRVFHAFILNTKLYTKFCIEHVGFFIHHTPLDAELASQPLILQGIDYTINFLDNEFREILSPSLKKWLEDHKKGLLNVSAVSCVRNGHDDISIAEEFSFKLKEKNKHVFVNH